MPASGDANSKFQKSSSKRNASREMSKIRHEDREWTIVAARTLVREGAWISSAQLTHLHQTTSVSVSPYALSRSISAASRRTSTPARTSFSTLGSVHEPLASPRLFVCEISAGFVVSTGTSGRERAIHDARYQRGQGCSRRATLSFAATVDSYWPHWIVSQGFMTCTTILRSVTEWSEFSKFFLFFFKVWNDSQT